MAEKLADTRLRRFPEFARHAGALAGSYECDGPRAQKRTELSVLDLFGHRSSYPGERLATPCSLFGVFLDRWQSKLFQRFIQV